MPGTCRVTAVKEVLMPKPNGGKRQLGIPTVKDRLVQQVISQVLSKCYAPSQTIAAVFGHSAMPIRRYARRANM